MDHQGRHGVNRALSIATDVLIALALLALVRFCLGI
jgi:hypothetical protein